MDNKNLNGGKYHYEINVFSQMHDGHNYWHP